MKKVLVITYYWPPSGGAGVQRWLKFIKYMREFGWEPVVYTVLNGEMPVIDLSLEIDVPKDLTILKTPIWEPYQLYKKFIGRKKSDKINASFLSENKKTGIAEKISIWIRGNFFIPDARKYWIKPSINFLSDFLSKNKIDFVISSGPPHSMHLIALGLIKKYPKLKWIADFRDPWTNIDFYEKLMLSKWADKKHHHQELNVLHQANVVLSVGKTMSNDFLNSYKNDGGKFLDKFQVISNGFDETDFLISHTHLDKKFSIAHIGSLVKDRNPTILWKVLSKLVNENSEFKNQLEIKLVGKIDIYIKEQLQLFGLTQYVNKIDYLAHTEVLIEQQKSKVLLLLINSTKNAQGILTGKFYEYLASHRPILAIGPTNGELADVIEKSNSGIICDFNDELALEKSILIFFKGEEKVRNMKEVNKYSRKELTRQLCLILDGLK